MSSVSPPDDLPPGDYTLWAFLADPALDPYRRVCERGAELTSVLFTVMGPARNEGEQLYRLYRDAVLAYSDRDLGKAEEKARAMLVMDPLSAHAPILLGNACFDAGRLPEALLHYKRAVEIIEAESDPMIAPGGIWWNLRDHLASLRGRIEMIVGGEGRC